MYLLGIYMSDKDYFSWTVIQWELYPIPSALGSQISSGLVSSTVGDHVRSPGTVRFLTLFLISIHSFYILLYYHSFSSHLSILFILFISFFLLFLLISLVSFAGIEPPTPWAIICVGVWAVPVSDDSRESRFGVREEMKSIKIWDNRLLSQHIIHNNNIHHHTHWIKRESERK